MNEQLESHEDLKFKYMEGAKERKDLYNKVLELRGKQALHLILFSKTQMGYII